MKPHCECYLQHVVTISVVRCTSLSCNDVFEDAVSTIMVQTSEKFCNVKENLKIVAILMLWVQKQLQALL